MAAREFSPSAGTSCAALAEPELAVTAAFDGFAVRLVWLAPDGFTEDSETVGIFPTLDAANDARKAALALSKSF